MSLFLVNCAFLERNTLGLFRDDAAPDPSSAPEVSADGTFPEQSGTPFSSVTPSEKAATPATVDVEKLEIAERFGNVEVIWEIPDEPVDGYVIRYGYSPDDLKFTVRVDVQSLDTFIDPEYGSVYRYLIDEVPSQKTVYFAVASVQGSAVSELSEVHVVKPASP